MDYVRLNGIYHSNIIQTLRQYHFKHFGFDFRPKSLNFTQLYKVVDMINENSRSSDSFYLQFANEKDFVIIEILKNIFQNTQILKTQLLLEFSDLQLLTYYESFEQGFVWHLSTQLPYQQIVKSEYLKKLVIPLGLLEGLESSGTLYSLLEEIYSLKATFNESLEIELEGNWNHQLKSSLLDFYHFNGYVLTINNQVEDGYQKINLMNLSTQLTFTKNNLNIGM